MGTTDPSETSPREANAINPFTSPVDDATIKRGHEIDSYDSKLVLSVPALVIIFFVLAFATVSIVFAYVSKPQTTPNANPFAVEQNEAPLNDRIGRIYLGSPDVNQPRLEPLRERWGNEQAITRPETPTGNSIEIHPEDIIPSQQNTPELFSKGPTADKSFEHISITEAMERMQAQIQAQKPAAELIKSQNMPSWANAGRGFGPSQVEPPKLPKDAQSAGGGK